MDNDNDNGRVCPRCKTNHCDEDNDFDNRLFWQSNIDKVEICRGCVGKENDALEQKAAIKISNQPFREDLLCCDLGDMWSWCLLYQYTIDYSFKFKAFESLESAKAYWLSLQTDSTKIPLAIQPRKFHLPYVPEATFNSTWGIR